MFPVIENLKAFFNSRPPLVVFMICLASFAIALITFAYIVKTKDIPDSDVTEDWNTFLEKFSKIDLCFSQNGSENIFLNATGAKLSTVDLSPSDMYQVLHNKFQHLNIKRSVQLQKITTREINPSNKPKSMTLKTSHDASHISSSTITAKPHPTIASGDVRLRNVSFVLNVEVILSSDKISSMPWTETQFVTMITGDLLKMKGRLASAELIATFTFPNNLSSRTCQTWDKGSCQKHLLLTCVQLQGPQSMFPNTPMPEQSELCHPHHIGAEEESVTMHFMMPTLPGKKKNKEMCQEGSRMSTYFSFDESLTVLLSLHDRSVINLRLMRTSYFLFVMVVTFLCYAMIKGKRSKNKTAHIPYIEKVPT